MWLISTALMAVSPLGNQHWSHHPHHAPTCRILKSSDIKLHFWSRGIIISKVTDKLLLQTEPLNSILALGYVSHKYGESYQDIKSIQNIDHAPGRLFTAADVCQ